jgi:hypothetical protein
MRRGVLVVWLLLGLGLVPAAAPAVAEPVARTYAAPVDRVWTATEALLKHLGWKIERADRSIGFMTTESRRMDGDDFGVYERGTRHRLRVHLGAAGEGRTRVTVERMVFKRERILWMDKDEPVTTPDRTVEMSFLEALGRAL